MLRDGAIGQLREIDVLLRYQWITDLTPWFWWDSLATGGGALNAGLTHFLGMLEDMIGGKVQHVTGEARVLRRQAPIVPDLHDYRLRAKTTLTAAEAANLEWRACDADNTFSALLQFAPSRPDARPVEVYMNVSAMAGRNAPTNGWYFYGDKGTLIGDGFVSLNVFRQDDATAEREPFPIPSHLLAALPQVGDEIQNKWAALSRDFVADIRGEPHPPYLTFRHGWRYQEAIDAIRSGHSWVALPT